MSLEINFINEVLNDLWSFHLMLFGITISIFTLLYSFILSKRDELKDLSSDIKKGRKDSAITIKESYAKKYISRLSSANFHVLRIACIAFILFIFSWIVLRLVPDKYIYKDILFLIDFISTLLIIIYTGIIFIKIYKHYKSDIRV